MIIPCWIEEQKLNTHFKKQIVANSVNYLQVQFHFEDEDDWKNLFIYAEFYCNQKNYLVEITEDFQDKIIDVPANAIQTPGFNVSVFGTELKEDTDELTLQKRITTNVVGFKVIPSGDIFGHFEDIDNGRVETWSKSDQALKVAQETMNKVNPLVTQVNELLNQFTDNLPKIDAAASLDEEFQNYKIEVSQKIESLNSLIEKTSQLNQQYTDQSLTDFKKDEINPLTQQISSINAQITSILGLIKLLQNSLSSQKTEINELKVSIDDLQAELEDLISNFEGSLKTINELSNTVNSHEQNLSEISQSLSGQSSEISEMKNEITELENKKVSELDTTFIFHSSLKLNENYQNGDLNLETGEKIDSETYYVSDYISVFSNSSYCTNKSNFKVCFYTKTEDTYEFLEGFSSEETAFEIVENANFIKIAWQQSDDLILEAGSAFTEDYENYYFNSNIDSAITNIVDSRLNSTLYMALNTLY